MKDSLATNEHEFTRIKRKKPIERRPGEPPLYVPEFLLYGE